MLSIKNLSILWIALSISLFAQAQSYKFLTIHFNNEQPVKAMNLKSLKLTFKEGQMEVRNTSGTYTCVLTDIAKMNLTKGTSGIYESEGSTLPNAWFNPTSNELILQGQTGQIYEIWSSDGKNILCGTLFQSKTHITAPFSQPGLYFVRLGSQTFKTIKL